VPTKIIIFIGTAPITGCDSPLYKLKAPSYSTASIAHYLIEICLTSSIYLT